MGRRSTKIFERGIGRAYKGQCKNTLYFFSWISSLTDREPLDQLRHCLDFMSDHRLRRQVLRHALHTTFNTIIFQKNVNSKERDSIDEKSKRVFRECWNWKQRTT